jgi:excisionase family DNA binding protein
MISSSPDSTPQGGRPTAALSVAAAATLLGVHERTVRRVIARGEILAIKHGRALSISRASLERYAERAHTLRRGRNVQRPHAAPVEPPTSFVGRDQLVIDLSRRAHLATDRLMTLTGPGGVGKTRLALRVLERAAPSFPDGVAFLPLASVTDPTLVMPTIARALGLAPTAERTPAEQVQRALAEAQLLLVLDNLEQVRESGPEIAALAGACPGLVILVTSRVRLHVAGEQCVAIPPLALPDGSQARGENGDGSLTSIAQSEAVRLFVDRARAAAPDFALTPANVRDVAAICHRLDGLPLALELAASRLRHLHLPDLLVRLDRTLPLLRDGPRDAPPRLQTMRAAIAWSYDLLTPHQQALFRWLAVFVGGFEGDAGAAVAERQIAPDPLNHPAVEGSATDSGALLDGLSALVDHSLLQLGSSASSPRHTRGATRYAILETVREFGLERLVSEGEEAQVRDAHADWCLALATNAANGLGGHAQAARFDRLEQEQPNFRAALAWLLAREDSNRGLPLVRSLAWFWTSRGYLREAAQWTSAFLHLPRAVADPARGWVLLEQGTIAHWLGDAEAAVRHDEAALAHFLAVGDQPGVGYARRSLGSIAIDRGALDAAAACLAASDAILMTRGTPWDAAFSLFLAGRLAMAHSQPAAAIQHFADATSSFGAIGDLEYVAAARCRQATAFMHLDDLDQARRAFRDGLVLAQELALPYWMAWGLMGAASLALAADRRSLASRLHAAVSRLVEETGLSWPDDMAGVAPEALGAHPARALASASPQAALGLALREAMAFLADDEDSAGQPETPLGQLTPREREVLTLLAQGLTDKEIAEALKISRNTAVNHVAAIRRKLGVPSRAAAAAIAGWHGQFRDD